MLLLLLVVSQSQTSFVFHFKMIRTKMSRSGSRAFNAEICGGAIDPGEQILAHLFYGNWGPLESLF